MVPRGHLAKGHQRRRRSHLSLKKLSLTLCSHCGKQKTPHTVCKKCGYYKGKQVIDVLKRELRAKKKQTGK